MGGGGDPEMPAIVRFFSTQLFALVRISFISFTFFVVVVFAYWLRLPARKYIRCYGMV